MKVSKEGKVKLEKGEVRIGNFFIKDEVDNEHIKVVDLNSCFGIRISKRMPLGMWMDNILKMGEDGKKTIKTWIGTMWSVLSVVPDQEYVESLVHSAEENLKRHPDWYRGVTDASEEEDASALEEVKGMTEFEEEIKSLDVDDVQSEA